MASTQQGIIQYTNVMQEIGNLNIQNEAAEASECVGEKRSFHCRLEPFYRAGARVLANLMYNINAKGFEQIPDEGPAIIICNHVAYTDGIIINAAVKNRQVRYIIDKDIYNLPIVNYFMRLNRAIPIAPNKEDVAHALDLIAEGLENGDVICIFPEGQLTYTGNLGRFKPGIEWMVQRTPVPVYPMAIKGLWGSVFSRKYRRSYFRFIPRILWRRISIRCGEAIPAEHVKVNYLQQQVIRLLREDTSKS